MNYYLATSAVRISGSRVVVSDPYELEPTVTFDDLKVELVAVADTAASLSVVVKRGARDIDAAFTADGRLRSLEYKAVGAGSAIVASVSKLVAFIGSIAISAAGALAGGEAPTPTPGDPRKEWEAENTFLVALLATNKDLAKRAQTRLGVLRGQLIDAAPSSLRAIIAQIAALEKVVEDSTAEVTRIEKLYAAWREAKRATVTSEISTQLLIAQLPLRNAGGMSAPTPATDLWEDFGVHVELVDTGRTSVGEIVDAKRADAVWWRQTREAQLWVWKRDDAGNPSLVSIEFERIVDDHSGVKHMDLTSSAFGTHGGSLTFNDDGSPGRLTHNRESAWGTLAGALGALPEQLAAGATQAKALTDSITGIVDAPAERARAAAARDLEIAKNKQELAGVDATAEDYATLLRAEQNVKIRTAERSQSAETTQLEDLRTQVDTATKRNELAAAVRSGELEADLVELKAEVARIELEFTRAHPGPPSE